MADFDLHRWFSDEELERCPSCGEMAGISPPGGGSFFCLACGHVLAANAHADDVGASAAIDAEEHDAAR